jgi:hypothetical protein
MHLFLISPPASNANNSSGESAMDFGKFHFGSIAINGVTYEHDVVIDRGKIRKRKKKPSKKFREQFGHTPVSVEEKQSYGYTGGRRAVPFRVRKAA